MLRLIYALLAAGTPHTNSLVETVLASTTLPAFSTAPGKVYRWSGAIRATATHTTDTLTAVLRLGTTALAGVAVFTSAAVDVADNDLLVWDLVVTCRSTTSVLVTGFVSSIGAGGTVTARAVFASLTVDNTVALYPSVTADWSVADVGNSVQAETFVLAEIV